MYRGDIGVKGVSPPHSWVRVGKLKWWLPWNTPSQMSAFALSWWCYLGCATCLGYTFEFEVANECHVVIVVFFTHICASPALHHASLEPFSNLIRMRDTEGRGDRCFAPFERARVPRFGLMPRHGPAMVWVCNKSHWGWCHPAAHGHNNLTLANSWV
jgi:hypothetical protein